MEKQNIVILGATGSLGTQTLQIIEEYPDLFQIMGMSAKSNQKDLFEYAEKFTCESLFLLEHESEDTRLLKNLDEIITPEMDHLMVLDHGLDSFQAVLKALAMGKRVSIANKELIIVHGPDLVYLAKEQQAELIPLDSEHNGLFQCLQGENIANVRRMIITASGGPFLERSWEDLSEVTPEQVLDHPNWDMGAKTTVDSATLVNKAFEVIETHRFFGVPYEKIEVRIHSQSIVHAVVEFTDGNVKMLAYAPDMRYSLGYALFYPDRAPRDLRKNDSYSVQLDQNLQFELLASGRFPCFDSALEIAQQYPERLPDLIAVDEKAVSEFLSGKATFLEIHDRLQQLL
jgi:1-deoxy-D-xylulose-5-phosphate reductoisomerase